MFPPDNGLLYLGDRELNGLQMLKFICAIMVVQIHTFSVLRIAALPICRIAVPIFFIISGYFMVNRHGAITSDKLVKRFLKILKITIIATAGYMAFDAFICLLSHNGLPGYATPKFWLHEIIFGTSVREHLWYLTAYLQTLICLYIALKLNRFPLLFILIPLGILLNLSIGKYIFLIADYNLPYCISRNTLTIAIPCILIGILIRYYEHKLPSQKTVLYALVIAVVMLYAEQFALYRYFPRRNGDIIILTLPVAVLTFLYFLKLEANGKTAKKIGLLGKRHSLEIYLWHPLVATIFYIIQNHIGFNYAGMNTLFIALLTLGFVMVAGPISILNGLLTKIRKNFERKTSGV